MRRRAALPLLALLAAGLALAATPGAHAAGFTLPAGRAAEALLTPGEEGAFEVPVAVEEDGLLYAKVLPTPGNAAHDGWKANASWRVGFQLVRADGAEEALGGSVEGDASRLASVRAGEAVTLRVLVRPPADAVALGGAAQRVHVALAWRPATPAGAGGGDGGDGASGGTLDSARALTLHVRFDGEGAAPPAGGEAPVEGVDPGPVQPLPDDRPPASARPAAAASAPVVPTWALAWGLVLLGGILAALVAIAVLLALVLREMREARAAAVAARPVPVRVEEGAPGEPPAADSRPHRPERHS